MLKSLLASAAAVGLTLVTGLAQAEIVTYEFTATITSDFDTSDTLAYGYGDVVTGTFSYDTEATTSGGSAHSTTYVTGVIDTGLTKYEGTRDDYTQVQDFDNSSSSHDLFRLFDFGSTTQLGGRGHEGIRLSGGDGDGIEGTELPSTLSLDDFAVSSYTLVGASHASVSGALTSLTKVITGAESVPELSANSAASSLLLLAGAALMLSRRRELRISHS